MLQCKDCEFCHLDEGGRGQLRCDPFTNIKEPECLAKWQLVRLDQMVAAYMVTVQAYKKLAPLQDKIMRQMNREMEDLDEADSWKRETDDDEPSDEPDEPGIPPLDDRL